MKEEQQLYMALLKGSNIGDLPCADSRAEISARTLGKSEFTEERMQTLFIEIITNYGVLMEEEEEQSFRKLMESKDQKEIVRFLTNLEKDYREYFIDIVSDRRKRVELILGELSGRTRLFIQDEDIIQIKKGEAQDSYPEIWRAYKTIKLSGERGIRQLHKETSGSVNNYLRLNSGNEDDAAEVWCVALHEFRKKLCRKPQDTGYYQWRPVTTEREEKAGLKTYFIGICRRRWIDELRRRKPGSVSTEEIEDLTEDGDMEEIRYRLKRAIARLDEKCREIVEAKFYGGEDGEGLKREEIAQKTGLKVSYISNRQGECIDKLGQLYKQELR